MTSIPSNLHFSKSHEWLRLEDDNSYVVGITDHAQKELGDLVYVDLPELATHVQRGDEVGVIESVKTAADIYSPIAGEVVAINESLVQDPSVLNKDPYGEGWLFRIKPKNQADLSELLDAEQYQSLLSEA